MCDHLCLLHCSMQTQSPIVKLFIYNNILLQCSPHASGSMECVLGDPVEVLHVSEVCKLGALVYIL